MEADKQEESQIEIFPDDREDDTTYTSIITIPQSRWTRLKDWIDDKLGMAFIFTLFLICWVLKDFKFFQRWMKKKQKQMRSEHMRDLANRRWAKHRENKPS